MSLGKGGGLSMREGRWGLIGCQSSGDEREKSWMCLWERKRGGRGRKPFPVAGEGVKKGIVARKETERRFRSKRGPEKIEKKLPER